ncbi:MAG: hypothetical protein ACTSUE_02630 [Promethearchaeota archaeon]
MKGSIGLGLLVGIISAIFLPYVFMLINASDAFTLLNAGFQALGSGNAAGLLLIFSGGFLTIPTIYNPNLIMVFTGVDSFLAFLPAMLTWLVCGLLAALFSQSAKKGIIASIVFVVVELLIFMLMYVINTGDILTLLGLSGGDIVNDFLIEFLGNYVITQLGFGIVGGAIGGLLSQALFGPEEI